MYALTVDRYKYLAARGRSARAEDAHHGRDLAGGVDDSIPRAVFCQPRNVGLLLPVAANCLGARGVVTAAAT